MATYKETAERILALADIKINGDRPWDIRVHDERLYARALREGEYGLGEAYMEGWWSCKALDQLITKVIHARLEDKLSKDYKLIFHAAKARLTNVGRKSKAFEVAQTHYDLGNDLYQAMLDKRMVYTCGYWKGTPAAKNLDEAQEAKLDLICKKIDLKSGQKVLDIGGGWGSFAKFAAEKYGAKVVNVTVSKEQVALADELCKGLSVENRLQDYRDVNEKFDHIVSIGMFEHVGLKNYREYMQIVNKCLKDDGIFLLHTIGRNTSGTTSSAWSSKYIFPNSMLPSVKQIGESIEGLFVMEDWHNFSTDYETTLLEWNKNFQAAWPELSKNYNDRFKRMWELYLLGAAAAFRSRNIQLWQIVLSKHGVEGGYKSIR